MSSVFQPLYWQVHNAYRRRGIATVLLDVFRQNLVYGYGTPVMLILPRDSLCRVAWPGLMSACVLHHRYTIPKSSCAFSTPTSAGRALAVKVLCLLGGHAGCVCYSITYWCAYYFFSAVSWTGLSLLLIICQLWECHGENSKHLFMGHAEVQVEATHQCARLKVGMSIASAFYRTYTEPKNQIPTLFVSCFH